MEKLLKQLFRLSPTDRQVYDFKPGYRTTAVKESLTFQQWCQKYRVGMMHGKEIRHFG